MSKDSEMRGIAATILETKSWMCSSLDYPFILCGCGKCLLYQQALDYAVKGHSLDEEHYGLIEEIRDRVVGNSVKLLDKTKV